MSKTKHTPKPWGIYFDSQDNLVIRKMFEDGTGYQVIATCHSGFENARLIVAAPDMLEALQEIVAAADGEGWSQLDPLLSKARAAIAKAQGNIQQAARASAVPIHVIELGKQVSESAVKQLVECLQQNENRFRPMLAGLQNIPHGRIDLEPRRKILLQEERDHRIYIAGPMTGIEDYNFPAFNRAARMLRESGWVVENPADHGVVEGASWSDYLAYDLTRLGTCGAVYLLRGWQNSKGARLEYLIAKELGMVIIEEWS